MKKVTAVLMGAALSGTAGGWVASAWAQSLTPHRGNNPAAVCTKPVGVTVYWAQSLGCFMRSQGGGCHCDDWDVQPPTPFPVPVSSPSPTPGWSSHGANGSSGWSDERMNERFLDHLGDKESAAKGSEKAELREDVKAFRANLKADPE